MERGGIIPFINKSIKINFKTKQKFMKTLKNVSSWVVALLLPVLGLLFPELSDPELIIELASTFGGMAVLIVLFTEGLKKLTNYVHGESWKYLPFVYSWLIGSGTSILFWALDFGIMAIATVWWHAAIMGIVIALSANGLYGIPAARSIIKALFGYEDNLIEESTTK